MAEPARLIVSEVALVMRVSVMMIYRLIKEDTLKTVEHSEFRQRILFPDLLLYLEQHATPRASWQWQGDSIAELKFYRIDEITEILGIATSTMSCWVRDEKFPAVKVGKLYVVEKHQLHAFFRSHLWMEGVISRYNSNH